MKLYQKLIFWIVVPIITIIIIFFTLATITEYRPKEKEIIFINDSSNELIISQSIRILTWNIGYAGLGENMDFFYDGGRMIRDTKENTLSNLNSIIRTIKSIDADIVLLQEVDINSHRTYNISEIDSLKKYFSDYHLYFAPNYKSIFVPIPLNNPIGKVEAGMVIMSKFFPLDVTRYQYPSKFSYPKRLFNLKRGLLSARYLTDFGDTLIVACTHNTAFDDGGMIDAETRFIEQLIIQNDSKKNISIIGGDWNQFPPSYTPDREALENKFFSPVTIDDSVLKDYGYFSYDKNINSLRYCNTPYNPDSITTITDYFYLTNSVVVERIKTIDLKFKYSDHNPVILDISLNNCTIN